MLPWTAWFIAADFIMGKHLVFSKTKLKAGAAGPSTSVTEREVCQCMMLETQ
ncbi:hypothetical protein TRAPUB_1699 [Trametes pubescens]|uniref:Uncharacterized protein n=1 Tax=Trametes pubescens TaxID=154538 RepID=A0A1M2VIP9_TRAPU|nr:hypothetical protein TRAPUB_1699 [Trametes pubescens]